LRSTFGSSRISRRESPITGRGRSGWADDPYKKKGEIKPSKSASFFPTNVPTKDLQRTWIGVEKRQERKKISKNLDARPKEFQKIKRKQVAISAHQHRGSSGAASTAVSSTAKRTIRQGPGENRQKEGPKKRLQRIGGNELARLYIFVGTSLAGSNSKDNGRLLTN